MNTIQSECSTALRPRVMPLASRDAKPSAASARKHRVRLIPYLAVAVSLASCTTYEKNSQPEIEARMMSYREQGFSPREAYVMSMRDIASDRGITPFSGPQLISGYAVGINPEAAFR